jgi:hypothetical protein
MIVYAAPAEPPGDLGIPDHAVPPSVALLRATLASSSDSFALEQLAASLSVCMGRPQSVSVCFAGHKARFQ